MKIKILQTTTTILSLDKQVESTTSVESYILEAEDGNILQNIKTGQLSRSRVCVTKKQDISNYIEVQDPLILKESPKV